MNSAGFTEKKSTEVQHLPRAHSAACSAAATARQQMPPLRGRGAAAASPTSGPAYRCDLPGSFSHSPGFVAHPSSGTAGFPVSGLIGVG